jgi:hypothetical protein
LENFSKFGIKFWGSRSPNFEKFYVRQETQLVKKSWRKKLNARVRGGVPGTGGAKPPGQQAAARDGAPISERSERSETVKSYIVC